VSVWGQSTSTVAQQRIVAPIDESLRVTLTGNTHPFAQPRYDRGPAPASMPAGRLLLVLKRSTQQEADLQTYLESVQDPKSASYHQFLAPEEFGRRFGVGDADLQTLEAWLEGHGLQVKKVSSARMAIEVTGTVGQVESAFQTSLHSYQIGGKQYWSNATDPQIPQALAPAVAGLASLNNFTPRPQYILGPSGVYNSANHTITPTYTVGDATSGYYILLGPADAATIYDTPTALNPYLSGTAYDGTGVTIGIAGDSNIDVTQNANYRATFGLAPKATTVVVDGTDPGQNSDEIEAYLDTQVAGGIAPNANVVLYTAADTSFQSGLFLAIQRALDDNQADILNVSFGACEASVGAAGNQYISSLWEQAAAQGIAVTVSSMDSGSAGCDDPNTELVATQGLAVNGIASTPYNVAVGGTDFDALYTSTFPASFTNYVDVTNTLPNHRSALSYIPEEPWNDSTVPNQSIANNAPISAATNNANDNNIVGGGGGLSTVYPLPNWQSGVGSGAFRNLPDVSFLAGNGAYGALWGICTNINPAVPDCAAGATGNNFNLTGVGGTSAAAPAFAGMLALVEQKVGSRLGQADYVLYALAKTKYASVFHDVTVGDNSVNCTAGTPGCAANSKGYDFLTGYNAGTGYDMASGLGSVDATQLANNWASAGLVATASTLQLNGANTPLSITHGQSVTVNASVTGSGGTPTGAVALVDSLSPATLPDAGSIAVYTLTSGAASGTTVSLPGGTYQVSTHYSGDTGFAESDSNVIAVTVAPETSTTTLKVAGYYDPLTNKTAAEPYYGSVFLLDAQPYGNSASATSPNGVATGTMSFKTGTTTVGTAPLTSSGVAELQTALLPTGTNSLTAAFPGDASFQGSTSAAVSFSVLQAPTALQVSTSAGPFNAGSPLTLTANFVDSAGKNFVDSDGVAPTGTVTFMNGTTTLGTGTVSGTPGSSTALATGVASLTSSLIPCGNASITATYGGDANYAASAQSPTATISIACATTKMTVTPASNTVQASQSLAVTVTLSPSGSLAAPSGTVTLTASLSGTQVVYTSPAGTISNGAVTIVIPANTMPLGALTIAANYSGDSYYSSSSSTSTVQVVSSGTITPILALTLPTTPVSGAFPVAVTISGPAGDPTPTGQVSVSGVTGSFPLTSGSASVLDTANLPAGQNTISVTYYGDTNYASGSASGTVFIQGTPTIRFSPSGPVIAVNQALSLTVTISTLTNLPVPTGTITLSSGSYNSGAIQMVAGAASFTIPANSLAVGFDYLTAMYSGDSNYASGSAQNPVTVNTAATPGLTVSALPVTVTVTAGATTGNTSTISVMPSGGFTGAVSLTASITSSPVGVTTPPVLSFGSTSPVNITGTSAGTATLTVTTTAAGGTQCIASTQQHRGMPWYASGSAVLACALFFCIPVRKRKWKTMFGMILLLGAFASGLVACGGGGSTSACNTMSSGGTTSGTYQATITATSGSTTAQGTVTIVVN
jgi:hypothetical protein